jgi:nucleoside-diphosphate-sugar epimerase
VLITGANGFIGAALLERLQCELFAVTGVARGQGDSSRLVRGPTLAGDADWRDLLAGTQVVVHTAARVHVMTEKAADPLAVFREVNVAGTLRLARQAAEAGVQRFIFLSTIKVHGEQSPIGRPFGPDSTLSPQDAYARSKAEAEEGLRALAQESGMEVVVLRPPLVYGPGVGGNFQTLMRWVQRGVVLPLGAATDNRRSLVALENLVDLIRVCLAHPAAANQTFMVSDGEDLSTRDLLCRLATAMEVPHRLLPIPVPILTICAACLGKKAVIQRLCGTSMSYRTPTKLT